MTTLRIGVQTRSLREPLRKALTTAAKVGADGVEIDLRSELRPAELSQTALRELRKILEDYRQRVAAATFPTRRGYGDMEDLDRRVAATQEAMRAAAALGAKVLINRIGALPSDRNDPYWSRLVETLTAIGAFGERVGVQLAAQTTTDSGPQLAQLIEQLPEHSLGIALHPSGLIHAGHSVQETIAAVGPHIVYVTACDAVRDFARQRVVEVELGRGVANIPEILGQLEEFGYQGWVTVERNDAADPVAEVANGVEYLRQVVRS